MPVTPVTSGTAPTVGARQDDPSSLSSTDFMNLLVTELQNQDPMEPMSTTEMSSQISQMTMNEQLTEMAATLDEQLRMSQSLNNTAMLGLVGRDVTVSGDQVRVADGGASGTMINVAAPGTAEVTILDADGAVVATYVAEVDAGLNRVDWDGLAADGDAAPDGEYTVEVAVQNPDGGEINAEVLMTGPVGGLRYEQGVALVEVFGTEFYVANIYQVS